MNSIYASTPFATARRRVRRPSLLARWLANWLDRRRDALGRRQLAELPPDLRRDLGLPPGDHRTQPDARTFDHNRPVGSAGAYW